MAGLYSLVDQQYQGRQYPAGSSLDGMPEDVQAVALATGLAAKRQPTDAQVAAATAEHHDVDPATVVVEPAPAA